MLFSNPGVCTSRARKRVFCPCRDVMQSISEFLSGKTLFVTGATGFLAKGFVEKILFFRAGGGADLSPDPAAVAFQRPTGFRGGAAGGGGPFSRARFARLRTRWGAAFSVGDGREGRRGRRET